MTRTRLKFMLVSVLLITLTGVIIFFTTLDDLQTAHAAGLVVTTLTDTLTRSRKM